MRVNVRKGGHNWVIRHFLLIWLLWMRSNLSKIRSTKSNGGERISLSSYLILFLNIGLRFHYLLQENIKFIKFMPHFKRVAIRFALVRQNFFKFCDRVRKLGEYEHISSFYMEYFKLHNQINYIETLFQFVLS